MGIRKIKDSPEKQRPHHASSNSGDVHNRDEDHGGDLFGGHHKKAEEGEGPWLVSYADMMTLLMGFFALIASFSKPDQQEFEKVKQAATEYFGGEYEQPYQELEETLREIIKQENLEDKVKLEVDTSGVALTFTGTFFFDSGNFVVKPEAASVVDKMAAAINKSAKGYNAIIEGHTDPVPISHEIIASNWELSGIRAARVAKIFEGQEFKKDQLTIMGWGETKPQFENFNKDGTPNLENQGKNRRVVIKVFKPLGK